MTMIRWCGVLFATAVAVACGSSKTAVPTTGSGTGSAGGDAATTVTAPTLKECKEPKDKGRECKPQTCGGNSVVINAFPIQGVRADGECSHEGAQLVPGSVASASGGGPCDKTTLDIVGDEFVSRNDDKEIVCDGKKLLEHTFQIRGWQDDPAGGKRNVRLKIAAIEEYTEPNGEVRPAYRLVDVARPNAKLCDGPGSIDVRAALGLGELELLAEVKNAPNDLVIPIVSELYDSKTDPVKVKPWWADKRPEWLHFACVDDALAKRSLYDLNTDNLKRSRAAMRMLTADYCGGFPVTRRGVKIDWFDASKRLEARWTEAGAACLTDDLRLLYTKGNTKTIADNLPARLQCQNCATPETWAEELRKCPQKDPTGTWTQVDRIPKCKKDCDEGDKQCKRMQASRVVFGTP